MFTVEFDAFWVTAFSVICLSLAACHPSGQVVGSTPRTDAAALSVQDIADRVERVYRDAKTIHVAGVSTRAGHRLEYTYDGTPDSFRTICYHDGELYGAFSFCRRRVQEFVPEHPQRLLLMYDSEMDNQIPHLVYARPFDCLYGAGFALWIGPEKVLRFPERIRAGELHGHELVDDRLCYVIEHNRAIGGNDQPRLEVRDIYYIDVNDFAMRRWNTYRNDELEIRMFASMELGAEQIDLDCNIWHQVEGILNEVQWKGGEQTVASAEALPRLRASESSLSQTVPQEEDLEP